jgi:hypothetical protein
MGAVSDGKVVVVTGPLTGGVGRSLSFPRPGRPEDVPHTSVYICSDEAVFITGIELPVDGDSSAPAELELRVPDG